MTGRVNVIAELPALLESIRNDRQPIRVPQPHVVEPAGRRHPQGLSDPVRPERRTGRPGPGPERHRTGPDRDSDPAGTPAADRQAPSRSGPGDVSDDGVGAGGELRDHVAANDRRSGGDDTGGTGRLADGEDATRVTVSAAEGAAAEFTDSVFATYAPQRLTIPDAHPHPGKLVQSAAMAAVEPPLPTYSPVLPDRLIRQGQLSLAQLEAIVYAGQAHSDVLPNGSRKGFFIGDGTGVGKGREISGIIMDNMMQGRRKAVWVSFNEGLIVDAQRDFASIGGDPDRLFFQGKTKAGNDILQDEGILFTTYSTLRGGERRQATDAAQQRGKTRLQQIVAWLGPDFDGVIAFDEAHSMGNAVAIKGKRGTRKPSQQAIAGINLQRELPDARVVYVSATGATEVSNLSYADRLGLWGEGTPFADVSAFISNVSAGGIAAMELISRDMKGLGMYIARSLSFDGVTYERLEHTLTELQEDIYNELAGAWQVVLNNVNQALEITQAGNNGSAKSAAMAQFWGAHQRFFNQIVTAMQTPAVIDHMRDQLEAGHAAVIQLVNTNEAAQERIIADATANDMALEELDFTPRQMLMDYVRNGFPVAAFEESSDENGNKVYVPVKDSAGKPVFDRQAIAMREALLSTLQHIRVPENPLDSIVNAFGADQVAEVTGRHRRFIQTRDAEGNLTVEEEKRGRHASRTDADLFQRDKKRILVFSGAGGTGYSFHADNTAENTRRRIHYILQPGWQAAAAVQGFGRTHRTNQAVEPHYVLPTTNLKAQKRFVSSIARRLDQLGALTRGQRQATGQGMFTAADNLESEYAKVALANFFTDLHRNTTGLDFHKVAREMGLSLVDENGAFSESKIPDIPQFLNRLLSLKTDQQNAVFEAFESRLVEAVDYAKQKGLFDAGLQTFRAQSIRKSRDVVAYEDARTGAKTRYVELDVSNPIAYLAWDEISAIARSNRRGGDLGGWYVAEYGKTQGQVFFLADLGDRLDSEGNPLRRGVMYGIEKHHHRYIDNADVIHRGWEHRRVGGAMQRVTLTRQVDESEAQGLWNAQLAAAPKMRTTTERMLVGIILPIWDRVEGSSTIYRLQTDDGEQLLGRRMGRESARQTLRNLGLDSPIAQMSSADVVSAIRAGRRAILANGWEISLSRVNREDRIEIKAKGHITTAEQRLLTTQGAFIERIQWAERVFLPAGSNGLQAFERITASKPVIDLHDTPQRGASPDDTANAVGLPAAGALDAQPFPGGAPRPVAPASPEPSVKGGTVAEKRSYAEQVADKLIEQLKQGAAPWQRPWDAAPPGSYYPMNPTTGKRYRGINSVYLLAQGRTDQRWMTYKQAAAVGAQVRKGEKGTPIQFWKFEEEQPKRDENGVPARDAEGRVQTVTVRFERPRVFFATVFNAEQIDGLPPLERPPRTWNPVERAERILRGSGAEIAHGRQDRAYYQPATDTIQLPDKGQFPSASSYYAIALHELGHWTGHASRLNRDILNPFGSEGYAKEELRAEIASMILGDELGIGHDPGQHAAYVGSWIKALRDDPLEIFRAAAEAEKIKDYVLAFEQQQVLEQGVPQPQADQRPPHEMTPDEFAAEATIEQLIDHGRRWSVTLGVRYAAFSDAPSAEAAVADVHRGAVNNALFLNTPDAAGIGFPPVLPPPAVLAHYPDLVAQYLPTNEQETTMPSPARPPTILPDDLLASRAGDTPVSRPGAEAWIVRHLERGTLVAALETANLAQIERVAEILEAMQPLNTQNTFWTRHALPQDPDALDAAIAAVIEPLEQLREEAKVGEARRAGDRAAFDRAARDAFDIALPHDWNGHVAVQASAEVAFNGAAHVVAAADLGVAPRLWSVYAQREDGRLAFVQDFGSARQAEHLAFRLTVIAAHSGDDEQERAAILARAHEDRIRRDPNRSDEDIRAAEAAPMAAELDATLVASDWQEHTAGQEPRQPVAADRPARDGRTYLQVPYKEKDEAKALGARWDRQDQAWYVPSGVDAAPFARWAQAAAETRQGPHAGHQAGSERIYLAVPYGERAAAKAAGAAWDKAARSWYAGPKADMERLQRWLPDNVPVQQAPAMSPRDEFVDALRSVGCELSGDHPVMDGRTHRIGVEGDRKGEQAGFYVAHLDGHPAGYIKNNRTGVEMTWKSKGYVLDAQEKARWAAEAAAKLAARAREQERAHEAAAQRVVKQLADLLPVVAPTPYIRNKGIQVHTGVYTDKEGKTTCIPAFDVHGKQWTMQYIQEDSTKRFAKDSRKDGCFHPVGGLEALARAPALVISEGYATAATNAEVLGFATVAAFDSGNLAAVARALHETFPDKPVLILGDDDRQLELTQGTNVGRVKAQEAAQAVGGKALLPIFAPGENAYPVGLPPITPQRYRAHLRATKALEDAQKAFEGAQLTEQQTAELKAAQLSDRQRAALEHMKAHTDFNDLATRSVLGREGVERQVKAEVSRVIHEAELKREHTPEPEKEHNIPAPLQPRRVARIA
ncbi:MAG: strawberry notch family protein [Proteobacteria bacterium]|nr:strawberry notch family protein [Pseudomonadota bacterium]